MGIRAGITWEKGMRGSDRGWGGRSGTRGCVVLNGDHRDLRDVIGGHNVEAWG